MRLAKVVVLLIMFVVVFGCGGAQRKYSVENQPTGENYLVKLCVKRVVYKKSLMRVWVSVINKTQKHLYATYQGFKLIVNGQAYSGSFRRKFNQYQGEFIIMPGQRKEFRAYLEFQHVPPATQAVLLLEDVREQKSPHKTLVKVEFPFPVKD